MVIVAIELYNLNGLNVDYLNYILINLFFFFFKQEVPFSLSAALHLPVSTTPVN